MSDASSKPVYLALSAVALTGIATAFYVMKKRKQNAHGVESSENFRKHRNVSWFDFMKTRVNSDDMWDPSSSAHPEGPNIGFGSNNSWLPVAKESASTAAKTDLLHTGHIRGGKLVVVMVGLPGRGKTYIARKVARYLRWISYRTRGSSTTLVSC